MREAGEPLAISVIAVRILAAKGIDLPSPAIRKMTKSRLRAALLAFSKRGVVRTVGVGEERKKALVVGQVGLPND